MPRLLTEQDLWDSVIGATILATGGGGIAPSPDNFRSVVDPVLENGLTPQLISLKELSDDSVIFMRAGASDGVSLDVKERLLPHPGYEVRWRDGYRATEWIAAQIREMDRLYPLPNWAEIPDHEWHGAAERRLIELIDTDPSAYIPTEIGPQVFEDVCNAALKGKPIVDADIAGHRAVPEFSLTGLNVVEAPVGRSVLTTPWGDMVVYDKVLSWQRFEDLNRSIAVSCGGLVGGVLAASGADLRRGATAGSISKCMQIGKAIREATDQGKDPVKAAIIASGGHVLFHGRISAFLFEEKGAFIWGETRIEGTREFEGHAFRIWYKNENHISFLDGNPYVTSPDLICIVDAHSSHGLSNFCQSDFEWGREVCVVGIPCAQVWHMPRGLKIFNPRHFGFHIDYVPLEERVRESSGVTS